MKFAVIHVEMPSIECSKDGGKSWELYLFFSAAGSATDPVMVERRNATLIRFRKLHPEWLFRPATAFGRMTVKPSDPAVKP